MKLIFKSLITKDNIDNCLSFIQDDNERKGLLRLLSKLDIRLSNPYKVGRHVEYKIWIINKFSRKRVYILDNQDELTLADVIEIIRNIVDVPDSFEEYCDTVVGADEDDKIDRYDYEDYRKRADRLTRVVTRKDITSIPELRTLPEPKVLDENDEEDRDLINAISKHSLRRAQKSGAAIIHVDNVQDHDTIQYYHDVLENHKKLMKQYGYDEITEEFNRKLFPVPKSDKELEGIRKDIDDFFKLLDKYNEFIRYLVQKYHVNIGEEELHTKGVIILHNQNLSLPSFN